VLFSKRWGGQVPDEVGRSTTSRRGSIRIADLPLYHWLPEHALVSTTRSIISFGIIQGVSLNGVNPAFHPMFVGLVLAGVIRDTENLLHASEESSLKGLALISDQRGLTNLGHDAAIPPEQGKSVQLYLRE